MSVTIIKKRKPLSKKHALRAAELLKQAKARHQAGHLQEAEALYISILNKYPSYKDAMYLLGVIAGQVGQHELAIVRFQQALAIKPSFAEAHNNLGFALQQLGRMEDAIHHYKQALTINPDFVEAYINMGDTLNELGRYEDAISRFKQALVIQPKYAEAHYNIGTILQELGQEEDAILQYEQALAIKPDIAKAHYNITLIKPNQEQVPIIEQFLASPMTSEEDVINYHYALSNIFNDAKSYSKAFEHASKGNSKKRSFITYDSKKHSAFVNNLIQVYSKDYFQEKSGHGSDSELPVFILGMPRSGTTLVEQIVSSHLQVHGAGELDYLQSIEKQIAEQFETSNYYPKCISLCDESDVLRYSAIYLEALGDYPTDIKRITDKAPSNFLRIGLIKTLFPKARIIHCQRNALDICTSIFLNYFTKEIEYSFDLTEIGQYYLDYEKIMAHWRIIFADDIYEVQYEELVTDQENISHQLIEYLGLDWDKACLDFHKSKRAVKTASNLQVRQPIYTKSVERWKRYEQHLASLIDILERKSN